MLSLAIGSATWRLPAEQEQTCYAMCTRSDKGPFREIHNCSRLPPRRLPGFLNQAATSGTGRAQTRCLRWGLSSAGPLPLVPFDQNGHRQSGAVWAEQSTCDEMRQPAATGGPSQPLQALVSPLRLHNQVRKLPPNSAKHFSILGSSKRRASLCDAVQVLI